MNQKELSKVLENHLLWLADDKKGARAELMFANLQGADLRNANLHYADLRCADLYGANLQGANLRSVNLRDANLREADLRGARLEYADLRWANLMGANLCDVNLSNAVIFDRKMIHADLKRHYILYVLPEVHGGPRFIAGCRNFTYKEAIYHWSQPESEQPEYVRAIEDYIIAHFRKGARQNV